MPLGRPSPPATLLRGQPAASRGGSMLLGGGTAMDDVEHAGARLGSPIEGAAEDFFRAVEESGALPVGIDAREAAGAVLCVLLERLDLEQARAVLDALPPAVSETAGRCPIHGNDHADRLGRQQFLSRIAEHFEMAPDGVRPMTAAVFAALRAQLPPTPARTVEHQLP